VRLRLSTVVLGAKLLFHSVLASSLFLLGICAEHPIRRAVRSVGLAHILVGEVQYLRTISIVVWTSVL